MDEVALAGAVLLGLVVLTPAAGWLRVPQPILLTLFGMVLGALPFVPDLSVPPEAILPVVLPPLLFAATQRTTVTEFREHAGAVLVLAVGLTVASAAAAAVAAHALGLSWSLAAVLGAIVSPPDPVAATSVARRLSLPHRLVTILEGEGMFNDATALVLFKVTLLAAVSGSVSGLDIGRSLVLALVVGLGGGLLLGFLSRVLLARIDDGYAETTITVLVPFLAYLGVEELGGSGVLAVLALGLYLRTYGHDVTTSGGWLLGRAVWAYADFAVTGVVFTLLGLEVVRVIAHTPDPGDSIAPGVAVLVTLLVLRAVWVFAGSAWSRRRARRRAGPIPVGWRESTVVSWAGMRGVVTVATALALPMADGSGAPIEQRDIVVAVALGVVVFTLVVQGLTLAPLTTRLGVGEEMDEGREAIDLRTEAARAALEELRSLGEDDVADDVRRAALLQYEGFVAAQEAMRTARSADRGHDETDATEELGELLQRAADVERQLVLDRRRRGQVSAAVADEVLRDIEGRAVRDLG